MNRRNEIVAGSLFLMAVFMTGTGAEAFVDLAKSFTKFQGPFVPVFFVAGSFAELSGQFGWEFHGNEAPFLFCYFYI